MRLSCLPVLFSFFIALFFPALAHAHIEGGDTSGGFFTGFMHPVLGPDHFLAMVAVGIISAQIGGRAIWSVPATFVIVMAIGGLIGLNSAEWLGFEIAMFLVEQGIIASVILLGLAIALDRNIPVFTAMAGVAFFAFFHGYAHGNEFPDFDVQWPYVGGFMAGTASLHIAGVLIGLLADKLTHGRAILRHAGSAMMGMGLLMQLDYIQNSYLWMSLWSDIPPAE